MALTRRERNAKRALKTIGIERFEAFIRAVPDSDRVLAVKLMAERLEAGESAESVFLDGEEGGYCLSVKRLSTDRYEIEFGCFPGGLIGDAGTWKVAFSSDGAVTSTECIGFMIS